MQMSVCWLVGLSVWCHFVHFQLFKLIELIKVKGRFRSIREGHRSIREGHSSIREVQLMKLIEQIELM